MSATAALADAAFLNEEGLMAVLAALNPPDGAGETRIVGGAVRNAILGVPSGDIDCATTLTPDEVQKYAAAAGLRSVPTGLRFGTVTVVAAGRGFEVTTLRRDVASDGRWADVKFGHDWEEDARRRDFTINALYCDASGRLYDPLNGYPDIVAGRVRFIGKAEERIAEDHLRALRFFRFHAWYGRGDIDGQGFRACVAARRLVRLLSAERLRQELLKLLAADEPVAALRALGDTGILTDLVGVARIACLDRLIVIGRAMNRSASALLRLAAMAVRVEEDADRLAQRLKLSRRESEFLSDMARWGRPLARSVEPHAHRVAEEALGETQRDAFLLGWAMSRDGPDDAARLHLAEALERDPVPAFPLKGADLVALGLAPGAEIGKVLSEARRLWVESDFRHDKAELIRAIRKELSLP